MKRNLPILLTLAALVAPTAAAASSASNNQYTDPYGTAPVVKHHKKHKKHKKHTVHHSTKKKH